MCLGSVCGWTHGGSVEQRDLGRPPCPSFLRPHDLTCMGWGVLFHVEPFHTPASSPGHQLITFYFYFFGMLRLDAHSLSLPEEAL